MLEEQQPNKNSSPEESNKSLFSIIKLCREEASRHWCFNELASTLSADHAFVFLCNLACATQWYLRKKKKKKRLFREQEHFGQDCLKGARAFRVFLCCLQIRGAHSSLLQPLCTIDMWEHLRPVAASARRLRPWENLVRKRYATMMFYVTHLIL